MDKLRLRACLAMKQNEQSIQNQNSLLCTRCHNWDLGYSVGFEMMDKFAFHAETLKIYVKYTYQL